MSQRSNQDPDAQEKRAGKEWLSELDRLLPGGEELSSLQSLVDILCKPGDDKCPHCFGRGQAYKGDTCSYCEGSGIK